jgi:hypothetical protein
MDLRDQTFGVEIETVRKSRREVAYAIHSVVGGTVTHVGTPACYDPWHVTDLRGRTWKVMADASLTNVPRNLQAELVTPILRYEDIPQLQEVVRAVRRAGARVDERCGLHVHVNGAPFDGRKLANLAKMVYKQEPLILHALGVSAARQRQYTRPLDDDFIRRIEEHRPQTIDELNPLWYGYRNNNPTHYCSTRYYGESHVMLSWRCGGDVLSTRVT